MASPHGGAHVILGVRDIETSVMFYRGRCGFELAHNVEIEGLRIAKICSKPVDLFLLEQPVRPKSRPVLRRRGVVLFLQVSNLQALSAELHNSTVTVPREWETSTHGEQSLLKGDSNGSTILLRESLGSVRPAFRVN